MWGNQQLGLLVAHHVFMPRTLPSGSYLTLWLGINGVMEILLSSWMWHSVVWKRGYLSIKLQDVMFHYYLLLTDRNDCRGYCLLGCENVWFGTQILGTYLPNCRVFHPRRLLFIVITGRKISHANKGHRWCAQTLCTSYAVGRFF